MFVDHLNADFLTD